LQHLLNWFGGGGVRWLGELNCTFFPAVAVMCAVVREDGGSCCIHQQLLP